MKVTQLNSKQRVTSIRYDSIDTLIEREPYMIRTQQNYLNRNNINEVILDTFITLTKDKYILNIVLEKID